MSTMMRQADTLPDTHTLAHEIAELSAEICLGGESDPQELLRRTAQSLAQHAGQETASLVILAQPSADELRWKPVMFSCSDDDVDLQSLPMVSICNGSDVPASESSVCCYRRADVMPDFEWVNSQSLNNRKAAGLFDYARGSTEFQAEEEQFHLVVELAGRNREWRPSNRDLDLTCATSDIMSATYAEHILRPGHARQKLLERLTPAQRQVSMLLTEGIPEPEIAQIIRRSPHTVHDHIKAVFRTWDVHSRAEAISLWRHPFETILKH